MDGFRVLPDEETFNEAITNPDETLKRSYGINIDELSQEEKVKYAVTEIFKYCTKSAVLDYINIDKDIEDPEFSYIFQKLEELYPRFKFITPLPIVSERFMYDTDVHFAHNLDFIKFAYYYKYGRVDCNYVYSDKGDIINRKDIVAFYPQEDILHDVLKLKIDLHTYSIMRFLRSRKNFYFLTPFPYKDSYDEGAYIYCIALLRELYEVDQPFIKHYTRYIGTEHKCQNKFAIDFISPTDNTVSFSNGELVIESLASLESDGQINFSVSYKYWFYDIFEMVSTHTREVDPRIKYDNFIRIVKLIRKPYNIELRAYDATIYMKIFYIPKEQYIELELNADTGSIIVKKIYTLVTKKVDDEDVIVEHITRSAISLDASYSDKMTYYELFSLRDDIFYFSDAKKVGNVTIVMQKITISLDECRCTGR